MYNLYILVKYKFNTATKYYKYIVGYVYYRICRQDAIFFSLNAHLIKQIKYGLCTILLSREIYR